MEELNPQKNREEVINEIMSIRQEVATMGANCFEIPTIDKILDTLREEKCTPEEALTQVYRIRDRKNDNF